MALTQPWALFTSPLGEVGPSRASCAPRHSHIAPRCPALAQALRAFVRRECTLSALAKAPSSPMCSTSEAAGEGERAMRNLLQQRIALPSHRGRGTEVPFEIADGRDSLRI
jgi:hypothetical protein